MRRFEIAVAGGLVLVWSLGFAGEPQPRAAGAPAGRALQLTVSPELELAQQVIEGVFETTPAELWRVWSTAEGFKKMGAAKCDLDFRIGGLIRSVYDPKAPLGGETTIQNRIIAYEPGRMIAFRIHQPPKAFPFPNAWRNTWSVATMTDLGDGRTHLRLATLGYDASDESQAMREFFSAGNAYVFKVLRSAFGPPAPAPQERSQVE